MTESGPPQRLSHPVASALDRIAASGPLAAATLSLIVLLSMLPGVVLLPPVDRTEVVFAETTRDMVARGAWLDPRYGDTVHQFRPVGTYWLQGVSAWAAGREASRDIAVYRLPSLLAVLLSVIAVYWLSAPRVGRPAALLAAGLVAVAPLTVLVGTLAIAEGLSMLPAVVAMLVLMRLYDAADGEDTRSLVLLLWVALGLAMLLNALQVPILVGATLVALAIMDRDLSWLKRTRPLTGVPLALAIAAPWLYVRHLQDGMPFAGMGWGAFIEALGGSQDMKLRALPGTFLLAAAIGFLPGVALIAPALVRLWARRADRLARFLLAWIIGYIVYLEVLSSKPGTYTVQVMFPAMALAVALLAIDKDGTRPLPRWHAIPPWPVAALFAAALFAGVHLLPGATPGPASVLLMIAVAALFGLSARLGREGRLAAWGGTGVGALALFAATLLGAVLPSIDALWPARTIARTLAGVCNPAPAGLLGFREPSGIFLLSADRRLMSPEAIAAERPDIQIVESRWLDRHARAITAAGGETPQAYACAAAYNTMRGCALSFTIFSYSGSGLCRGPARTSGCPLPAAGRSVAVRACD